MEKCRIETPSFAQHSYHSNTPVFCTSSLAAAAPYCYDSACIGFTMIQKLILALLALFGILVLVLVVRTIAL